MIKKFSVKSYGHSDVGLIRKTNQDMWASLDAHQFFVLADGMGGHKAGDVAAKETVLHLCQSVKKHLSSLESPQDVTHLCEDIKELIQNTNRWVHKLSTNNIHWKGMGTTLCSLLCYEHFLVYAHVGDSRIYRLRNSELKQLTRDHSLEHDTPIRHKPITAKKHSLTRAIGTSSDVLPEIAVEPLQYGDLYLMCSDGLSDLVTPKEILRLMSESSCLKSCTDALIEAAKSHGGRDNITALMIEVHA